jgi:hypothetical protein
MTVQAHETAGVAVVQVSGDLDDDTVRTLHVDLVRLVASSSFRLVLDVSAASARPDDPAARSCCPALPRSRAVLTAGLGFSVMPAAQRCPQAAACRSDERRLTRPPLPHHHET